MTETALQRVLVADDHDAVRTSFCLFLEDCGYAVVAAANGREALAALDGAPFDVALVDLWMPEADGWEVLSAFNERSPETALIVISGTGRVQDAVEALHRGAWDYLMKPVEDLAVLKHAVDQAVERAQLRRENLAYRENLERLVLSRTAALRESEERLRAMFAAAVDVALITTDVTETNLGPVTEFSPGAEQLFGYGREEMEGLDMSRLFPEGGQEMVDEIVRSLRQEDAGYRCEAVLTARSGALRSCLLSVHPIHDSLGQLCTALWVAVDVTERKELEAQLRHTQKMDAIGQLAGGVAHDFNNQLAGILGMAELLYDQVADEQARKHVNMIIRAARRSEQLTQQLLAFSRKGNYRLDTVDVHELLDAVVMMLERSDKRLRIHRHDTEAELLTRGDPGQLENAFLNLGLNARDAMPDGGTLSLVTEAVSLSEDYCRRNRFDIVPGDYVKVKVVDTGAGMDAETVQHIFEPFFTTKPVGEGAGMGLAAVYGTVKSHAGAITVYSDPSLGTTFSVYLPRHRQAAGHAAEAGEEAAVPTGDAVLLVAEDEEIVREMALAILRSLGYTVQAVTNGREAVDYYREHWREIDLVVLDMIMPQMDGNAAFHAMREINPAVKAILTSGYSLDNAAQQLLDAGMKGFVQKPFLTADLARVIQDALAST